MKKFIIIIMAAVAPFVNAIANNTVVSDELVTFVSSKEGFRAEPYVCPAGVITIGHGFTDATLISRGFISEYESKKILRTKLTQEKNWVKSQVKCTSLTNGQLEALTSLCYNIGRGNFSSSTLLKKIKSGDLAAARAEFPKWRKAGGKVMKGLVKRRAGEVTLFWDKK